ncbi:MAG: carbohydrate binding family 9 domain-containing protein [Candidatus Rariloculaceae bacterium]
MYNPTPLYRTLLVLSSFAIGSQASGQQASEKTKSFQMVRTTSAPVIDGVLEEEIWSRAAVIEDLHQFDPIEFSEASQKSSIYLLYDADALYVAGRMWDTEPERITANVLRQGASIDNDDQFTLIIGPYNNQRDGYQFLVNPHGVRSESIYIGSTQLQENWEGIWQAAATRDEKGWIAEMAIPFKTLSFDPETDTWGINFGRRVQSRNERMAWVSRNRLQNPAVAGLASGFKGLSQGFGLDLVPSISVSEQKNFSLDNNHSAVDPSLDLFYRLTPSLNGSLTFNTDFSATEVDDRQVNLTRFGLFFPEKRDFFLRDADIFEFGGTGSLGTYTNLSSTLEQNGRPFFSRQIGLSRTGQPVDLEFGGKLSGRVGPWNLGALAIKQDQFSDVDATNLFVGRATLNVLSESSLGIILTEGDPRSNLDNSVAGVDFNYLNTRISNNRLIQASAWYQESNTEGIAGNDAAYGLRFDLPSSIGIRFNTTLKVIQENFNPAQGFVNRAGIKDISAQIGWIKRYPQDSPIRMLFTQWALQRVESLSGNLQSQTLNARAFQTSFRSGDIIRLLYTGTREVLDKPFTVWDPDPISGDMPIMIPVGDYSFNDYGLQFQSEGSRKLAVWLTYRTGNFYHGKKDSTVSQIVWTPTERWRIFMSYSQDNIDLPEGKFDLRLARAGLDLIFSNTLSWANLIQYDNDSEVVGLSSRLHWIPQAGREAFIVLNHNLQDLERNNSFHSTLADLSLKLNYTFRF